DFHVKVIKYHTMIDKKIAENNSLIKQRDELLPLLMNGQVSVNSDLSNISITACYIASYYSSQPVICYRSIIYKCLLLSYSPPPACSTSRSTPDVHLPPSGIRLPLSYFS
ncbi:MAG: hypothetical protein ACRCZY_00820, partial [Phocaeicola sp.]